MLQSIYLHILAHCGTNLAPLFRARSNIKPKWDGPWRHLREQINLLLVCYLFVQIYHQTLRCKRNSHHFRPEDKVKVSLTQESPCYVWKESILESIRGSRKLRIFRVNELWKNIDINESNMSIPQSYTDRFTNRTYTLLEEVFWD